jgi:hypothetical protein
MRLSVDGIFFRHEPVRSTVAADLEEIFLGLCQRLRAAYGFAWDEETAETLFPLGMLVTLCDVPWGMELGALKAVNSRWNA